MANLYRVATGNWNATNSWATTSGGTGSVTTPTSADNCYFDANTPVGTVTVNVSANCADLDFTGYTGTFSGTAALNVYGNLILAIGTTYTYTGTLAMRATSGTKTITTNGKTWTGGFQFNGSGGTFQLQDDFTTSNTVNTFSYISGTFNANSKTVSFIGGDIVGNVGGFTGGNAFYNLVRTGNAVKVGDFSLSGNIEVTNNLTINGNSSVNRIYIRSTTKGTARTITCNGTVTVTNADFQDITGAGTANWDLSSITGGSGDCGGNSGITFTTPVTTTCSAGTTWSTATWSVRVPLPQDTATFSGSSRTIIQDMPRIGSVDFTGSSGLTWTTSTACSVFGSINLTDLGTLTASTQTYTFEGDNTISLTNAGKVWTKNIFINKINGTFNLQDELQSGVTNTLRFYNGTINTNSNSIIFGLIDLNNNQTRNINLGNSIIEITGTSGNGWYMNTTGLTLNAGTSIIKYTGSIPSNIYFNGGGASYNNIWNATTGVGTLTIQSSNTFNDIKTDGGRQTKFTASTTQTVNTFTSLSSDGNLAKLRSTTTTPAVLAKAGGGTISLDYMDVDYITGSPVDTWYMGTHSVDGGHNTNIYFDDAPVVLNTSNFFLFF